MSRHDRQHPSSDDLSGIDRFSSVDDIERFEDSYRAVSKAAVVAVALSILGLFGVWLKSLLVMAPLGFFFSLVARRTLCLLHSSPCPPDPSTTRMPSSA